MISWLLVTQVDIVLSASSIALQHWKFFAQIASAYFCAKFSIVTPSLPQPASSNIPIPITLSVRMKTWSPIRRFLPDSFRAP